MAPKKVINRLSALDVKRKESGMHLDGAGLYLQVTETGRSWIFRYKSPTRAKVRYMGLGPAHTHSLAQAREIASKARAQVLDGIDPIDQRDAEKEEAKLKAARTVKFEDAVESYISANAGAWTNPKQERQWRSSLQAYAYPTIRNMPVAAIEDEHVRRILSPIWQEKQETARRVRSRIEAILERESALKHRKGENPARRIAVTTALGKQSKSRTHFVALPYIEIGAFMEELREQEGIASLALQFTILTAARTNEVIAADFEEFDLSKSIWTVPADRMKARAEHRVPLSEPAAEIIKKLNDMLGGGFVFPGAKKGRHLSNMAMLKLLERMDRKGLTVHGFRSTFRDWAAEQTNYVREVAEQALAHTIQDAVERAYRRGDLYEKRTLLMIEWAKFCQLNRNPAEVVPLHQVSSI